MSICMEAENKFASSGLWNGKRGVQVWGGWPVELKDGGVYVISIGASSLHVSGAPTTDQQQLAAQQAAWNVIATGPRYRASATVRLKGKKWHANFTKDCDTPEQAMIAATASAVASMLEREAEAAKYLADRQDDRKRAEELHAAVVKVFG